MAAAFGSHVYDLALDYNEDHLSLLLLLYYLVKLFLNDLTIREPHPPL